MEVAAAVDDNEDPRTETVDFSLAAANALIETRLPAPVIFLRTVEGSLGMWRAVRRA